MSFEFEESSGFSSFALFHALKLHFSSDGYDFFKYHGKTNVSKNSFSNRKDKYSFYKLSRKYSLDELKAFYIANFLRKDVSWVGELTGPEGEENFKKWNKTQQSLTYVFENDIINLLDSVDSAEELLIVKPGKYPILLQSVMEESISIETLVILNDIMNFFPMWTKKIDDDIIWPTFKRRCIKYAPFIDYDKKKLKCILVEKMKEHESI
jgi:hypothetical protein